jgi:hypothetical protein
MIGASVYGFVDYKKTSQKKEFTSMYDEEKKVPVIIEEKTTDPVIKKAVVADNKKMVTKKQQSTKENAFGIEPVTEENKVAVKETKEISKTEVNVKASDDSNVEKKVVKKKKKLNSKLFSRAPLREEELIELPEPPKEEVKKTENKEQ